MESGKDNSKLIIDLLIEIIRDQASIMEDIYKIKQDISSLRIYISNSKYKVKKIIPINEYDSDDDNDEYKKLLVKEYEEFKKKIKDKKENISQILSKNNSF